MTLFVFVPEITPLPPNNSHKRNRDVHANLLIKYIEGRQDCY